MSLHHSLLGLADGDVKAFGFAVALSEGRLRTYRTVGVHDHFSGSGRVCLGRPGGVWFINGCFHSLGWSISRASSASLRAFVTPRLLERGNQKENAAIKDMIAGRYRLL